MTWALACTGAFALLGWGAALVLWACNATNKARVRFWKGLVNGAESDRDIVRDELVRAYDRMNAAEDQARLAATELIRAQKELRDMKLQRGAGWIRGLN